MPRKKQSWMPHYSPSEEEYAAHMYCMNNNIRLSPGGINGSDQYTVDISLDGKKWTKSPKKFKSSDVWEVYYNYCLYYYNKRKDGS